MSLSRRQLLGMWRRPAAPAAVAVEPAPAPAPAAFSLESFYGQRAAQPAPLPHFTVGSPVTSPTSPVGVGLIAAAPAAADTAASPVPVPAGMVPVVLAEACLATRSFCSVCVERCPRPGAIVVAGGRPQVIAEACDGCGRCVATCPAPVLAFALVPRAAAASPPPLPEVP